MDGINGTIFAYGQTAAGKTFSMFGNEQNPGVITRAVHDVFDKVTSRTMSLVWKRALSTRHPPHVTPNAV